MNFNPAGIREKLAVPLDNGAAAAVFSPPAPGTYNIEIDYPGATCDARDPNYEPATVTFPVTIHSPAETFPNFLFLPIVRR